MLETVTLVDPDADSRVSIAPTRGAIATRFSVRGRPVFYLDEDTLRDPTKNVRGGNPVLFPSPGPLPGDRFTRAGRAGSMKQHGFARQLPWSVVSTHEREATLRLASDDATRAQFPWDFVVELRYALAGSTLTVDARIENPGPEPLPFALGYHPYFYVPDADKPHARVPTSATRAWDNVAKTERLLGGPIDLALPEVDLHLVDHGETSAVLELPGGRSIVVRGSPDFGRWVIWTVAGKDYVCLEPWTAPAGALATGDRLLEVAPGASRTLTIAIEAT